MAASPFRLAVALLTLACGQAQDAAAGGRLTLTFDTRAAADVVQLLRAGSASPSQIGRIAATPAGRELIEQTARFDASATAAEFGSSLAMAANGRLPPGASDPFGFGRIRQHTTQIARLCERLTTGAPALQREVAARLQPDLPGDLALNAQVVFVLGGSAAGWVQPGNRLYIALQYFDEDYDGLIALLTHELYHLVQYRVMPATASAASDPRQRNAENLMIATMMEGTAALVGNPVRADDGGPYLERIQDDFALFDTLMFRAVHDGAASYQELHSLGFSGSWGSPLYVVGYRMAQVLGRYAGRPRLAAYLRQPAANFFADYIVTCDLHRSDSGCVRFDAQTTHALLQMKDQATAGADRPRLPLL